MGRLKQKIMSQSAFSPKPKLSNNTTLKMTFARLFIVEFKEGDLHSVFSFHLYCLIRKWFGTITMITTPYTYDYVVNNPLDVFKLTLIQSPGEGLLCFRT